MENANEKTYTLANAQNVNYFMSSAKYGDSVELIDVNGERIMRTFVAAGRRKKDLCYYVKFNNDTSYDIMRVNLKNNYLTPVTNKLLFTVINSHFETVFNCEQKHNLNTQKNAEEIESSLTYASYFKGGVFVNYFLKFLTIFVSIITLGLAYPAMQCVYMRWKVSKTYLNSRKLVFTGNATQLYKKYIIWLLLSIITFGIYYVVKMRLNLIEWETANTHVEGMENSVSTFDGKWYALWGVTILANLITVITLSFGIYWAHCYIERWYAKHKIIDGVQLKFTGTGMQFFGKCIIWTLLTVITFGIYSFWLAIKVAKWTIKHTVFTEPQKLTVRPLNFAKDSYTEFTLVNQAVVVC